GRQRSQHHPSRRFEHLGPHSKPLCASERHQPLAHHALYLRGSVFHDRHSFHRSLIPSDFVQRSTYSRSQPEAARFLTSRSCVSDRESRAQSSFDTMRSSLPTIHVEKSSIVIRRRRSNSARRYGLLLRTIKSTLITLS